MTDYMQEMILIRSCGRRCVEMRPREAMKADTHCFLMKIDGRA